MATTPKKTVVHWALDASLSDFGSPFSEASSAESSSSTSSLQYINAQLIAHGFTQHPGLSLDGMQKEDSERLVKCLLGMLSQRIEDMSRTEDFGAKIRTLSYEHERLNSMYKTALDRAGNAEREMNTHKSRLASANLALQNSESAHKRTTAELQRLRTTVQGLRAQHATELKKVEKEKERVMERWSKLADSQAKHGSSPSGLTIANLSVVEASDVQLRGKGQGFLEIALEQAEKSRNDLADETRTLRGLVHSTANELQRIVYTARKLSSSEPVEEPAPISSASLFPLSPPKAAQDKLNSLLASTKELSERFAQSHAISQSSSGASSAFSKQEAIAKEQVDRAEVVKLQTVIKTLRKDLDEAQKQSATYAAQAQDLLDRFTNEQQLAQENAKNPAANQEQELLDEQRQELEEDRRKFTEAAVKLGKDKAALEAERIRFLEERRSWQLETLLNEHPKTAPVASTSSFTPPDPPPLDDILDDIPPRSPRKSPRKVSHKARTGSVLGKAEKKTTRISRRSSGLGALSPRKQTKVIPAFETEVVPSAVPEFKLSMTPTKAQQPPRTSAFVLPPPSPAASFNVQDGILSSAFESSIPKSDIPPGPSIPGSQSDDVITRTSSQPTASSSTIPVSSSAPTIGSNDAPQGQNVPNTPLARRPFPVAKPFAMHMVHAYSPVKPSPLSRILMMATSPESPDNLRIPSLGSLTEETDMSPDISPTPGQPLTYPATRSLAAELGVSDDDVGDSEEVPLREKKPRANVGQRGAATKDTKGKGRADDRRTGTSRSRATTVTLEKENKVKRSRAVVVTAGVVKKSSRTTAATTSATKATSSDLVGTAQPKIVPKVKGGARRVPIGSAEAAPGWKG
ncbi:Afadin and alpha-actinin-binding-domain-containing protein [Cristinia sonorae]|uniref:Afadin and alpha-actinin-binding-domain-containing protein n=1 Tax=Cristinia sonorae TaxID=1940300 RepID=A0A8K0UJE7_9AGAR|nr:Afadin and alpha-actinin-binding-domain-containing protein [Cristinia sonorae]